MFGCLLEFAKLSTPTTEKKSNRIFKIVSMIRESNNSDDDNEKKNNCSNIDIIGNKYEVIANLSKLVQLNVIPFN